MRASRINSVFIDWKKVQDEIKSLGYTNTEVSFRCGKCGDYIADGLRRNIKQTVPQEALLCSVLNKPAGYFIVRKEKTQSEKNDDINKITFMKKLNELLDIANKLIDGWNKE